METPQLNLLYLFQDFPAHDTKSLSEIQPGHSTNRKALLHSCLRSRFILRLHHSLLLPTSFYLQMFWKKLASNSYGNNRRQSSCGIKAKIHEPQQLQSHVSVSHPPRQQRSPNSSQQTTCVLSFPPSTECKLVAFSRRPIFWGRPFETSSLYWTSLGGSYPKLWLKAALRGTMEPSSTSSKFLLVATSTWGVSKHWELMTCQIYECFLYQ